MTMMAEPTTIDAASIRLMTADEARQCVTRIRDGIENVRALLLDLHEREGWRALGYQNWRECAAAEFSLNQSRAYQLLDAAKVDRILSTFVENASLPETHARELAPLKDDPEAVRTVYAEVRDATNGKPTQMDMRSGVDKHLARPARPAPKPAAPHRATPDHDSQDIPDELATAGADVDPAHEFPFNNEPPTDAVPAELASQEPHAQTKNAEQWCQGCGEKYKGEHACDVDEEPYPRGSDIPCSRCGGGILVNSPEADRALAKVVLDGRRDEILCLACPGARDVSWRQPVDVRPPSSGSAASDEGAKEEGSTPALPPHTAIAVAPRRSAISDPTPARRTGADGGSVIYVDAQPGAITRALFSNATVVEMAEAIAEEAQPGQFTALIGLLTERLSIEQAKALYRTLDTRIRVHNDRQTTLHLTGRAS